VSAEPGIDLARLRRVHLVGAGGMHMSAIGSILLARGIAVTGSDLAATSFTERLQREGAVIHQGHDAANLDDPDLVVTTVAAKETNPELQAARARGIPVAIRAEMVAALMQGKRAVCVAGTHGKTTTSSLLAYALRLAGRDPTYLLGGDAVDLGRNAAPGRGDEIVVEADEYAEAFLHYEPDLAIVTNVEIDHLDYYGTAERVVGAFAAFMARVRQGGLLVVCDDSPLLHGIVEANQPTIMARVERYALDHPADWNALIEQTGAATRFTVTRGGEPFGSFTTPLPGRHNVANCLGGIAALHALDLPVAAIQYAIASFHGARRRFESVGEAGGITLMDDYAHHPTEIATTLAAAHERFPGRRIVAVFQPHTYSRTSYLLDEFRACFAGADALLLLQTYAARETVEQGIDAYQLAAVLVPQPPVAETAADAVAWLQRNCRAGDVVITLGAGNVDAVGRLLLERLPQ
jgi:UDP-N-acetylmuramate--alanine ligase